MSKRWEPASHICVSRWGWAWCTSSSPGAFAQLAGAGPTDWPPPVTRDLCPHVLGISTVTLMAQGLSSAGSVDPNSYSWVDSVGTLPRHITQIVMKLVWFKKKKFIFLGFLVCRRWWFSFKALFLLYWYCVFPLSKDWDSSTTPDFRA